MEKIDFESAAHNINSIMRRSIADNLEEKSPYFDKNTTNIIKGIALVLMFVHHFYGCCWVWGPGLYYPRIAEYIGEIWKYTKICVPVFCFLTGYVYYYNRQKTFRYSFRKITDILIPYWIVFLVLAGLSMIAGYRFTWNNFIREFFLIKVLSNNDWGYPTMTFCWYVGFYCSSMLLIPLAVKCLGRNILWGFSFTLILAAPILTIFSLAVSPSCHTLLSFSFSMTGYFPILLVGYLFAQYNLFQRIENSCKWMKFSFIAKFLSWLVLFFLLPLGRCILPCVTIQFPFSLFLRVTKVIQVSLDVIYTPLFIFCIIRLSRAIRFEFGKRILAELGKYSLLMWFLHCMFANQSKNLTQLILYFPRNPILVTLWGLLICYLLARLLDPIVKKLTEMKNRMLKL